MRKLTTSVSDVPLDLKNLFFFRNKLYIRESKLILILQDPLSFEVVTLEILDFEGSRYEEVNYVSCCCM